MAKRRSPTTLSLIVAFAIGAAALLAQPADASGRFEDWTLGLDRIESTLERVWLRMSTRVKPVQPAEGAILVPGGKEGAILVPGGIASPTPSQLTTTRVTRDRSY